MSADELRKFDGVPWLFDQINIINLFHLIYKY